MLVRSAEENMMEIVQINNKEVKVESDKSEVVEFVEPEDMGKIATAKIIDLEIINVNVLK